MQFSMAEMQYNLWTEVEKEVGVLRMPLCYVMNIYLNNKHKSIKEICSEIKEADRHYDPVKSLFQPHKPKPMRILMI